MKRQLVPPILQVLLVLAPLAAAPPAAEAQLVHRPRCSNIACPDSLYRLELERMTLLEGPLANDRHAGDLRFLRRRILHDLESAPEDARLWLALSEAEAGLGDPLPAVTAATRALDAGADSSLALRARGAARMRLRTGVQDGAETYLQGVALMTRESAPRFLADMLPMLTPTELDWWRSAGVEALRGWTRDYWEHRAALAGVTVAERLAEHVRRMAVAADLFTPPGTGSGAAEDDDLLRRPEYRMLPYDDRGLVFVRRGPPHDQLRVPTPVFSDLPSLTWLYAAVEGGYDVFHFAKSLSSGTGYRAVVAPACDHSYAGNVGAAIRSPVIEGSTSWVMDQAGLDPQAREAFVSCFSGDAFTRRANAAMNELAMRQASLRALRDESPRQPFRRPMPAFFDFYMFRGEDGETQVVTPVVVPVESDEARPIELLVTFADVSGGVVRREARSASVRTTVDRSVVSDGEGWGVTYAEARVEPTPSARFRVVVRDPDEPDHGGMWGGDIEVRNFEGPGPHVSDIVLSASGPVSWSRGEAELFLLPARNFRPGTPAALFYEVYDLEPGSVYRTELTIAPVEESLGGRILRALTGSGRIRVGFDAEVPPGAGRTLQEVRSLRLPEAPGRYTLTVRVVDAEGREAESSRGLVIADEAATAAGAGSEDGTEATRTP